MTIVKRTGLGRAMTWSELDGNWDQVVESTAAAQQSAALAAASQAAAAVSETNAAQSASDAASQAEAAGTLRTDLASTDTGKGLSLISAEDGTSGQTFFDNADQFAGAYESAIITIKSANRWITYNGSRWYVKPGVSVPFTTTGLNATSWETDSAKFISDNLLNLIESDDGFKYVGSCASVDVLRTIEPTVDGQKITLQRYSSECPIINGTLIYDESDTTTSDDDYSVFVTSEGARWKVDVTSGIDIRYAGILSDLSNLYDICQKIFTGEVNKANSANGFQGIISRVIIPANFGQYTVTAPIIIPTFMQLSWYGNLFLNYTGTTGGPLWFKNTQTSWTDGGLAAYQWFSDIQGGTVLNGNGGNLFISGTRDSTTSSTNAAMYSDTFGVRIAELGTDKFSARDFNCGKVTIRWVGRPLQIDNTNNYCNTFEGIVTSGTDYGVYFTPADLTNDIYYTNSGERITFRDCTFGDSKIAHVYAAAYGYYTFQNCSLDYTSGDVVLFPTVGTGVKMTFDNCHIEGFDGYLVNSPTYTQYGSWHLDSTVLFTKCVLMINYKTGVKYPFRKLVNVSVGLTRVAIDDATWALSTSSYYNQPLPYVSLSGWDNISPEYFTINAKPSLRPISWMYTNCVKMLPCYNSGAMGRNRWYFNNASGVFGRSLVVGSSSSTDANTLVYFDASDTSKFTASYDTALDSDGHMSIVITSTDASATLSMILSENMDAKQLRQWQGGISVAASSVSSGAISMYSQAIAYAPEVISVNVPSLSGTTSATTGTVSGTTATIPSTSLTTTASPGTVSRTKSVRYTHTGNTVAVSSFISGASLSASEFVGVFSGLAQYFEGDSLQLRLCFTGFVGTIKIKCPVWWSNPLN